MMLDRNMLDAAAAYLNAKIVLWEERKKRQAEAVECWLSAATEKALVSSNISYRP